MGLDEKGRCCGRKPFVYKREGYLWCSQCDSRYPIETKRPGIRPISSSMKGIEYSDSDGRRVTVTPDEEREMYAWLRHNPLMLRQYSHAQIVLMMRKQKEI